MVIEARIKSAGIPNELKQQYCKYAHECRLVWEKMRLLPVPVEGHLGFRKGVLSKFAFLEDRYGFRVTETSPIRIRYQSCDLFIELNYVPGAPELTFELGELDYTDHPSFSLDDLAFWAGEGLRYDYSRFDLESASGLAAFVGTVARFVEVQADSILRNWTASANALSAKQLEREKLLDS